MEQLGQALEGKYEVVRQLSEGGMGRVYLVRHVQLDELQVVKAIRPQLAEDEEFRRRFLREARIANRLRHPRIARILDFEIADGGVAFIVMEFIAGKTLRQILHTAGPPSVGLAVEIAVGILEALGFLHRQGFVHRDVSPENVMLTRDHDGAPDVRLIDLGIAKHVAGAAADLSLTHAGVFLGKAVYSSPEQFGAGKVDARSDLYSFGVLLYELLTGRRPFEDGGVSRWIRAHLNEPPLAFDVTDPAGRVPAELRRIVLEALAKRPDERIASAEVFRDRLEALRSSFDAGLELDETLLLPGRRVRPETSGDAQEGEIEALLAAARSHLADRLFDEAFEKIHAALALKPTHPEARQLLGEAELHEDTARRDAQRLRAELDQARRERAIGRAARRVERQLELGEVDTAEKELTEAVCELGRHPTFEILKQWIASLRQQRRSEQIEVQLANARHHIGADDPEQALAALREALALDPEHEAARGLFDTTLSESRRRLRRR